MLSLLLAVSLLWGCRDDMVDQQKAELYEASPFFSDGASARKVPFGTVRSEDPLASRPELYGVLPGSGLVTEPIVRPTPEALSRGKERYFIFCSPCHGLSGHGDGMVVLRGLRAPASFHTDRLREQPIGYFVDVMVNGFGAMPSYADRIPPDDLWAIALFVGALQLSQHAPYEELPAEDRDEIRGLDRNQEEPSFLPSPGLPSSLTEPGAPERK